MCTVCVYVFITNMLHRVCVCSACVCVYMCESNNESYSRLGVHEFLCHTKRTNRQHAHNELYSGLSLSLSVCAS